MKSEATIKARTVPKPAPAKRSPRLSELTDEELIGLCRDKDQAAFAELVNRYHLRMYNYCHRMTGGREDAEDAAQEVFLRLARKLPEPSGGTIGPWLYRVATTVCIDEARRRARRIVTADDDEALVTAADPAP